MPDFGFSAASLQSSEKFAPYSKVILKTDDYDSSQVKTFTAGDDSGRTLEAVIPWASQEVADSILESIRGYAYQPITAKGVIVDPATELGDDITVGGVSGFIENQDITFGGILRADIAAPGEEQIDHEYQFIVKRDRKTSRAFGAAGAAIRKINDSVVKLDAGLAQITDYDPETGYAIAEEALYATILDEATGAFKTSRISATVVRDGDGNLRSLAAILADQIKLVADTIALKGRVDLTGILSIRDGGGITANGPIYAPNQLISGGEVACADLRASRNFYYRDTLFEPTQITSTTGAVMALGYT